MEWQSFAEITMYFAGCVRYFCIGRSTGRDPLSEPHEIANSFMALEQRVDCISRVVALFLCLNLNQHVEKSSYFKLLKLKFASAEVCLKGEMEAQVYFDDSIASHDSV